MAILMAFSSHNVCWIYAVSPPSHSTKLSNPTSPSMAASTSLTVSVQGWVRNVNSKYFIVVFNAGE